MHSVQITKVGVLDYRIMIMLLLLISFTKVLASIYIHAHLSYKYRVAFYSPVNIWYPIICLQLQMYDFCFVFCVLIQHLFICRPLDSTDSEDAAIELRTVATLVLAVCSLTTWLDLIQS
jgi:hypothetical protein